MLALGSEHDFPHDRSLEDTIAAVRTSGAVAVIPWGFGKLVVSAETGARRHAGLLGCGWLVHWG